MANTQQEQTKPVTVSTTELPDINGNKKLYVIIQKGEKKLPIKLGEKVYKMLDELLKH